MDVFDILFNFCSTFFFLLGLFVFIYYAVYIILPWYMDCDFQLAFAEKFGTDTKTLKHRHVWITGASSGIGEHLAYALAKAGCDLILSARRESELKRVEANCLAINPKMRTLVVAFDVCDINKHQKAVHDVIAQFGVLDIMVNNAGRSQRANWEKIDLQVDRDMFELNVFSILSLCRLVIPHFRDSEAGRKGGHIVVMSSCAGLFGIPFSASYAGSKHSLHGYFECLRNEKMETDLAITLVCPGPIQTNFLQEAFTENPNEKFGEPTPLADNKLSVERCAYLTTVGIANKLPEIWISPPTVLQLVYLNKYYPNLGRFIMKQMGTRFIQRLRDNKQTVQEKTS